ncbi:MAG: hypothetical protein OXI46_00030 [Gemmatimonadota bacterium]|nr:hypothetical protein [Gemmatimonadota bacterium]
MQGIERFELFTDCALLPLVVLAESEELEERLRAMAERRLRAARLYGPQGPDARFMPGDFPTLAVEVVTVSPAFMYTVALRKWLVDEIANVMWKVPAWQRSLVGTYANDTDFIVQGVSETLDEFILEYLRVNGSAC